MIHCKATAEIDYLAHISRMRGMLTNLPLLLIFSTILGCSHGSVARCDQSITLRDKGLVLVGIKNDGALSVATYTDKPGVASLYQTDFDRRNLRVMSATGTTSSMFNADLCDTISRGGKLNVNIPAKDQVGTCEKTDTKAHNSWVLRRWVLQYADQQKAGYVIECTIATTSRSNSPETYFAVSECYALEEINRFLYSLDNISM